MKTRYILFWLLFLLPVVSSLEAKDSTRYTNTRSHVVKKIYLDPTSTVTNARAVVNVLYMDGFGRKLQEVSVGASPVGGDLITPYVYGVNGLEEKLYLFYRKENNNGMLDGTPLSAVNWSHLGATEQSYAFTRVEYDGSPLRQVVRSTGPGNSWHNREKGVSFTYRTNETSQVKKWRVDAGGQLLGGSEYYSPNTLSRLITSDEDGKVVEEFKNSDGQVLLLVAVNGLERLETYLIYDNLGQLRYALSPEASSRVGVSATRTTEAIARYGYYYEYDKFGRQVMKQLPGCDPVYMVYDKRDRLVMSQDGKQREEDVKKWSYILYDNLNREIELGEVVLPTVVTHATLQMTVSASSDYTPTGTRTTLQYLLYDTYSQSATVPVHAFVPVSGYATSYSMRTSNLVTSVKNRVLGTSTWLTTTMYYDERNRVIQTVSDNLPGGTSRVDLKYDFVGNVMQQRECHLVNNVTNILEIRNSYDDWGHLLSSTARLNDGSPAMVSLVYDAVGRLVSKTRGSVMETMTYNTRDWLTSKESLPFKMKLRYESPVGGTVACWNGNISEWEWQQGANSALMYGYTYDGLNRLNETIEKQKSGSSWASLTASYLEKGITYDRNGNIQIMQRIAAGTLVDNLTYTYSGNQLTGLTESVQATLAGDVYSSGNVVGGTYAYDKNGNMVNDSRCALNFSYNVLNLLSEVKTTSGTLKAKYSYLADGTKLRVRDNNEGNGYDYTGSLTYKKSDAGLQLEAANFGEGVIRVGGSNSGQQEVDYFLTDHLGSIRVIVDGNGVVKERNDYYPFGARHVRGDYPQRDGNRYKYNGKEEQMTGDLEYLDYGARMYDSGLGRWFSVDPLTEKYLGISSYAYVVNNPIRYIDPDGRVVKDPDGIFKKYKNWLIANRDELQDMINKGNVELEIGNKLMSHYSSILRELSRLEKSKQVYTIFLGSSGQGGYTYYNKDTGEVMIEIVDNNIGLVAHELAHAYQYEKGEISFSSSDGGAGSLYDLSDEIKAFNRQRALENGSLFFKNPNDMFNGYPVKMNGDDVRRLGESMTPPAYQDLEDGPIGINTPEGKNLREQTREAGSKGSPINDYYFNWQKDYQKKTKKKSR